MTENLDIKTLLADSLREKKDSYIITKIMEYFPSPMELIDVSEEELKSIKGIGDARARQIKATLKLAEVIYSFVNPITKIRKPEDVFQLLSKEMRYLQQECFVVLLLNTKNVITHRENISKGTLNAALVHPRDVFRVAIKRSAASIICAHNHPSGDPEPSLEDIRLTERLKSVGEVIGIDVLDHVVIGHEGYVSLKERGVI